MFQPIESRPFTNFPVYYEYNNPKFTKAIYNLRSVTSFVKGQLSFHFSGRKKHPEYASTCHLRGPDNL